MAANITRQAVREMLENHPGIRGSEVARWLGISEHTAQAHIRAIRDEWARKDGEAGK